MPFLLGLFVLSTLYPFIYVAGGIADVRRCGHAGQVTFWPVDITLAAYEHVLSDRMFWIAYGNTCHLHVRRHAHRAC